MSFADFIQDNSNAFNHDTVNQFP